MIVFIVTISMKSSAQFTLNVKGGLTFSMLTDIQHRKNIPLNATYEVKNLNSFTCELDVGYKINKDWSVSIGIGSFTSGFQESAVYHSLNTLPFGGIDAYKGKLLYDYSLDFRFMYANYNLKVGYKFNEKLKISIGLNKLIPEYYYVFPNYYITSRYSSIINLWELANEKIVDLAASNSHTQPYNYPEDTAINFDINYAIYKGLYLQLSYLRGFKKILSYPADNETYNQAISFNIGYQWVFGKKNKKTD